MQRETAGGGYKVELVDALPAPPEKGVNVWTLRILDAELAPADGVSVSLEPFMPEHGHGTSPATFYGVRQDEPGTFVVSDLNLTMPGIWDVTVHVTSTDAAAEDALFTFCAEG